MSFLARFDGPCLAEDCSTGQIERGDEVEYFDGALLHVGCASRERRGTLPPLCGRCQLHHHGGCW